MLKYVKDIKYLMVHIWVPAYLQNSYNILKSMLLFLGLKSGFSKKATKIDEITTLYLMFTT